MKAANLIQECSRVKLGYCRQRMQMYFDADACGRKPDIRAKMLMTYFSLLSVFARINEVLAEPAFLEKKNFLYRERLDREVPPPPPPPCKDPPNPEDEELHYRYEMSRMKYAQEWERAGRMVVGQENFEKKIRNLEKKDGPAEKEKRLIAAKCYEKAVEVMSEKEHHEYMLKAWRLENDWMSMDDSDVTKEDIERWMEEKEKASSSQSKAKAKVKA